jgi:hypothetical protein
MNKLLLIFLLSILILYAQCTGNCGGNIPDGTQDKAAYCTGLTTSSKSKECVLNGDENGCVENALPCNTGLNVLGDNPSDSAKAQFCEGLSADENYKCKLNSGKTACEPKPICSPENGISGSSPSEKENFCKTLLVDANKICQLKKDGSACEPVEKPTNSGSILNTFKITFTLIIIFAIL